jgi:hypothetical protein
MGEKLKGCPFCGGEARRTTLCRNDVPTLYGVVCNGEKCSVAPQTSRLFESEEEATEAWNRRPDGCQGEGRSVMEHTPGPWTLGEDKGTHVDIESSQGRVAHAIGKGKEGWANAHLIAAAPDLLVALETIQFQLGGAGGYGVEEITDVGAWQYNARNAIQTARAAIAKAKGGTR